MKEKTQPVHPVSLSFKQFCPLTTILKGKKEMGSVRERRHAQNQGETGSLELARVRPWVLSPARQKHNKSKTQILVLKLHRYNLKSTNYKTLQTAAGLAAVVLTFLSVFEPENGEGT